VDGGTAVILTALGVEYQAVRAHLKGYQKMRHPEGTVYEEGRLAGPGVEWCVAIAQVGAGNTASALETERAIAHFKPDVLLFVGVAGGIKDVVRGDVVAADAVYDYETGKVTGQFLPRGKAQSSAYALVEQARVTSRGRAWKRRIRSGPAATSPHVYVGALAAGEKVIANRRSSLCRWIATTYSDALAVEMEGSGFLRSAWANGSTPAMVIRGISDCLDDKGPAPDSDWQPVAAAHAAAFAIELLIGYRTPAQRVASAPPDRTSGERGRSDLQAVMKLLITYHDALDRIRLEHGVSVELQAELDESTASYNVALTELLLDESGDDITAKLNDIRDRVIIYIASTPTVEQEREALVATGPAGLKKSNEAAEHATQDIRRRIRDAMEMVRRIAVGER
jgi:nucleoside phosphorylase